MSARPWIGLPITLMTFALLAGDAFLTTWAGGIPFTADYTPRHYPAYTALGIAYVLATWILATFVPRLRTLVVVLASAIAIASVAGWFIYHAGHPGRREVFVWDRMEPVTPYHVQLAAPLFITAIGAALVAIVAMLARSPSTAK